MLCLKDIDVIAAMQHGRKSVKIRVLESPGKVTEFHRQKELDARGL